MVDQPSVPIDHVLKCPQNVTAFLMNQNRQFADAVGGINFAREGLDPARYDQYHSAGHPSCLFLEQTAEPRSTNVP